MQVHGSTKTGKTVLQWYSASMHGFGTLMHRKYKSSTFTTHDLATFYNDLATP